MTAKSGFYKVDQGELLYAPNFVVSPNYELYKEDRANYNYPIDGWTWFDSQAEASEYFKIKIEE